MKNIIIISVEQRQSVSASVQEVLTQFGCFIKTRLGITDSSKEKCSQTGLIILEFIGSEKEISSITEKLAAIKGVKVKTVSI